MIRLKSFLKKAVVCTLIATMVVTSYAYVGSVSVSATQTTTQSYTRLEDATLTDFSSWKSGIYNRSGGFDKWPSFLSTSEYLSVSEGDVYKITSSDSTYAIIVSQYDSDFDLISYDETISNGAQIVISSDVSYVTITIYNPSTYSTTYNQFSELFASGFTINAELVKNYSSDIDSIDFNNSGLWRRGLYSPDATSIYNYTSFICMRNTISVVSGKTYTFSSNPTTLRFIINELDKNGNVIGRVELNNSDEITFDSNVVSIKVSAYNPSDYSMTLSLFREYLDDGVYEFYFSSSNTSSTSDVESGTSTDTDSDKVASDENLDVNSGESDFEVSGDFLSSLNSSNDWELGTFDKKGQKVDTKNYIRLDGYYTAKQGSFEINLPNNKLRLIINEYDKDFNYIKTVDLANYDIYTANEDSVYITYSIYEYENEAVVENTTKELIDEISSDITITKIEDLNAISGNAEKLTGEVKKESLSNSSNYRVGLYYSWGGEYKDTSGTYCTRNKYAINSDTTYYININDSRIKMAIFEYKEDGTAIKYVDHLTNGSTYTPSADAAYIGVNISSSVWGVDVMALLDAGLTIDIYSEYYSTGLETIDIADANFSDYSSWTMGAFSTTGYNVSANSLAYGSYLDVSSSTDSYVINLDNHYLRMIIVEYDSDGNYLQQTTLQSGQKWTPSDSTSYIGLFVKNQSTDFSESDYRTLFNNDQTLSLSVFTTYTHNTSMNVITATEFMNIMNVGWNLGNSLDSHYGSRSDSANLNQETVWGNIYVTEDLIEYVKEQGFNTIRIPVTWYYNTYTDEDGHLKVYDEWFERVQTVVDYAIKNDMYVILNTHHDQEIIYAGTTDENFAQVLSDATDLWTEIANYFADYDEHLIFESYNEVDNVAQSWNYSDTAASQMNQLNQVFVDTVRSTGGNNAKRILIVPTLLDGHDSAYLNSFVLPTDTVSDRLIVEVHDYSLAFDQDVDSVFEPIATWASSIGVPVIIGEFGTKPSYSPSEYRVAAVSNYVARAASYGIKCIYWDDGNLNNYGLINRVDYSLSNTAMLNAMISAVAYKTTNKTVYNSMDSFVWQTLNQSTGGLQSDKYWGTIVTDIDGKGIEIPEGTEYITILLKSDGDFYQAKVHYVHFYDEDMNIIETNNSSAGYKKAITFAVPDQAKYVRIGINNSYMSCKEAKYAEYFNSGLLSLTIGFVDIDDVNSYIKDEE